MVRIIKADDPRCVQEAVAVLKEGGLVCYPTDTVYGIGVLASDDTAVRRLFKAKGRGMNKPLPLLLADPPDVSKVTAEVSPLARRLIQRFWPGALTIVLRKRGDFHSLALAAADTVAVRVPNHRLLREIIRRVAQPITGTSANRSGRASPLTAPHVASQLGNVADLIIDGGRCPGGKESTVIDITEDTPRLLRLGLVSPEMLKEALGQEVAV